MSTKIYVVKYIKDERRWEPRNVGLLVISDEAHASRFIGEQPDGRVFKTGVRELVNDTDIYVDWVNFFKRTLTPGEEGIAQILSQTDGNYAVFEAGEVWQGPSDPDSLVAEYFPKLVKAESDTDDDDLEPTVEQLLAEAGIADSEWLSRDTEVPSVIEQADGRPVPYKFHYVWMNGQKLVGERFTLKNPGWTREQLWKLNNIASDITRVAFVTSRIKRPGLEAELNKGPISERINVDTKDALDQVVRLFNG